MKNIILFLAVILTGSVAQAGAYARVIGMKGSPFEKSAGFDIPPRSPINSAATVNIGIITHSTADGSLCDYLHFGSWCVPENWTPLQLSFGGSFADQAFLGGGSSINVAPQIGAIIFAKVNSSSSSLAQSVKASFAGTSPTAFRIGLDFDGDFVQSGQFVSFNKAFPGRGPLDILSNAARLNVGLSW